jgi:hypothetical protein
MQRTIEAEAPEAYDLIGHLASEWGVPTPRLAWRIAPGANYDGLYEFRAKPPTIWVGEEGTNANVLIHEFTHHLQWRERSLLHRDSLGRWLWHKPSIFVPLIDRAAETAAIYYRRRR